MYTISFIVFPQVLDILFSCWQDFPVFLFFAFQFWRFLLRYSQAQILSSALSSLLIGLQRHFSFLYSAFDLQYFIFGSFIEFTPLYCNSMVDSYILLYPLESLAY